MKAAELLVKLPVFLASDDIACYLSYKDEFPTAPIIEAIWHAKKNCYVPKLSADEKSKELEFVKYQYGDALRFNRFKILEPAHPKQDIAPQALQLVIAPLIAFDLQGHRLGTGGGFYDTTFSFKQENPDTMPIIIGLGYKAQQASELPHDSWDLRLKGVLTEKAYLECT